MYMLVCRERCQANPWSHKSFKVFDLLCTLYCRLERRNDTHHPLKASNKKDQIYGLISLCEEDYFGQLGMTIDYSQSWQDVYVSLAQKLRSAGYLDLLALCQSEKHPSLPSWAPVWHDIITAPNPWFKVGKIVSNHLFSSASSVATQASFLLSQSEQSFTPYMRITGIFLNGILKSKSTFLRSYVNTFRDREFVFGKLFREIEYLCEQSGRLGFQIYTDKRLREALWRIPIRDYELKTNEQHNVQRATQISFNRYTECLPLLKAVENYVDEGSNASRDLSSHPIMTARETYSPDSLLYLLLMGLGRPTKPFITRTGYIGLGPADLQVDDVICIFFGSNFPHVLRKRKNDQAGFTFVGEAFVYGLMDGEVLNLGREPSTFDVF